MAENFFGITDTGRQRDNNEDAFLAERLPTNWILACVIDGVGGYEGGEVAADIARTTISKALQNASGDVLQILRGAAVQANGAIMEEKRRGGHPQMACVLTMALVDVNGNAFHYAHVGDTRLYLLRDHSLVKVTKDHSFVGFLEDSGRLSEREAMTHPKRNEINKALGFDPQIEQQVDYIETGSSPFLPGDLLLLCSDGLTDLVPAGTMTEILVASTSLTQKAKALVDAANAAGGKDNITVVLVRHDRKPQKQRATKPVLVKKAEKAEAPAPAANTARTATSAGTTPSRGKGRRIHEGVILLAFLAVLFAGLSFWLWRKNSALEAARSAAAKQPVVDSSFLRLRQSVNVTSETLILSPAVFGPDVVLREPLHLEQDSLRIDGQNLVLRRDSAYSGPAFTVSDSCKLLVLENLTLHGFEAALLLNGGTAVQLRNVRFDSVAHPILQAAHLATKDSVKLLFKTLTPATSRLTDSSRNSLPHKP